MKKKLCIVLEIVLPLFLGSGTFFEIVRYLAAGESCMNPVILVLLCVMGFVTGIDNIWKLVNSDTYVKSNRI